MVQLLHFMSQLACQRRDRHIQAATLMFSGIAWTCSQLCAFSFPSVHVGVGEKQWVFPAFPPKQESLQKSSMQTYN